MIPLAVQGQEETVFQELERYLLFLGNHSFSETRVSWSLLRLVSERERRHIEMSCLSQGIPFETIGKGQER